MVGRLVAAALRGVDPAEELGHPLLVDELALDGARLGVDHERRAAAALQQSGRGGGRDERHAGLDRPVQDHVLAEVDNALAGLVGRDRPRRGGDRLPDRDDREDRRCDAAFLRRRRGIVGGCGVGADRVRGDLVANLGAGDSKPGEAELLDLSAHFCSGTGKAGTSALSSVKPTLMWSSPSSGRRSR